MEKAATNCSYDTQKSTKGASKLRRDLINGEIANLRELLPLPATTRQRLSQLQLMALVCVYIRKANYFQQVHRTPEELGIPNPGMGFSKALTGFLMMMTQSGKLLYISDNAAEYLGHSMEDLLIHGDSFYDIIDKNDQHPVQNELLKSSGISAENGRIFLCRMNVSRNVRRQMRFGDQKVVLVQGKYLSYLPLCSRNEPVFLAKCTPVVMPETRECVVQGATNMFTSIHALDMKYLHIDSNGEFYLGYSNSSLKGLSWYHLLHWECLKEAQFKHRMIIHSDQEKSCILLVRLQHQSSTYLWVHCVLQMKDNVDSSQSPIIICTNQVLSEAEAAVMQNNSWIYQYYSIQNKLQYGVSYEPSISSRLNMPVIQYQTANAVFHAATDQQTASAYMPYTMPMNGNYSGRSMSSSSGGHNSAAYVFPQYPSNYQLNSEAQHSVSNFATASANQYFAHNMYQYNGVTSSPRSNTIEKNYVGNTFMDPCLDRKSPNILSSNKKSGKEKKDIDAPNKQSPLSVTAEQTINHRNSYFNYKKKILSNHSSRRNIFADSESPSNQIESLSEDLLPGTDGSTLTLLIPRRFPFSSKLIEMGQKTHDSDETTWNSTHVETAQKVPDIQSPDISPPLSVATVTSENSPSYLYKPHIFFPNISNLDDGRASICNNILCDSHCMLSEKHSGSHTNFRLSDSSDLNGGIHVYPKVPFMFYDCSTKVRAKNGIVKKCELMQTSNNFQSSGSNEQSAESKKILFSAKQFEQFHNNGSDG